MLVWKDLGKLSYKCFLCDFDTILSLYESKSQVFSTVAVLQNGDIIKGEI